MEITDFFLCFLNTYISKASFEIRYHFLTILYQYFFLIPLRRKEENLVTKYLFVQIDRKKKKKKNRTKTNRLINLYP